ncbi:MAG: thiolase domain-containing protein [Anaerolineae bacterium]|nr:thiolase domain-containing protein [Anaerolineae bacterium]MBT4311426.1 thiolase domain-containing protein [Anaerolineae bacterium]MBT4459153.1 thiolase domain-containing protein [Anaerolineae bacterium]MBT4841482.1 thiolase domain-containing protein [Anaerolineae bacterium]MBT6061619.1 thiolase domain-containing protein [Anaerolineae bacterium]
MTDNIVIAGIGQTTVGEHWQYSIRELAHFALEDAIKDAGGLRPQALFVGNMLAPNLSKQAHLGALIADFSGLIGIEAVSIEAAGASGGAALRQGYLAVKSGMIDVALIVGVEKFTDMVDSGVEDALATATDSDFEAVQGLTPTSQAAMLMRRYLREYNLPADALAGFPVTAHANAVDNPNAMFQRAIKASTYARAGMVSEPLNMFDAAPPADGAAAIILTRSELLPAHYHHRLVRVSGSASASDMLTLHDRRDPLSFDAARRSVDSALLKAGVTREQISFFEYHDAYSIYAALSLEAAGFAERGKGWELARDGEIAENGKIPCATMGGLKARGFPGGATGVYQAVEAVSKLRDTSELGQIALIQSLGGPASTAVTHVLESV